MASDLRTYYNYSNSGFHFVELHIKIEHVMNKLTNGCS